jgi:glutathione-regulated potassium-efflux system protein KefB
MAPAESHGAAGDLLHVVALLGAAVVVVPIFRRLQLGSVLGYLAAGVAIGPFGIGIFSDPSSILHVAELGVVMFLFVIGLEMEPSRLWSLRTEIFGLGLVQVIVCGLLLTGVGMLAGFSPPVAFIAAMGFVLSSTAIVMQLLEERGEVSTPAGQRVVSILLFEDLSIVPLLAAIPFLAPTGVVGEEAARWLEVAIAVGAVIALVAVGRWLLNPMFAYLAQARAREVMTAAALLVVLGAALLMQVSGLSMAMGAFLAGVLLSESSFRHELEADIEPFRGLLLGLFFLGVGMSLDLSVLLREWPILLGGVIVFMLVKSLGIYAVARVLGSDHSEGLTRAALLAQGGEFAFVLYAAATAAGVLDGGVNATLTATVILSMILTPLAVASLRWILPTAHESMDGIELADDLHGNVLIIGFGRFAQVASQGLLARGIDVTIIENDTEMIRSAAEFGFKVYYGDGTRLDVLRTSGAEQVQAILVCVDDRSACDRIVTLVKSEFPHAKLYVRAFDRSHAIELIGAGVDGQVRETFESALAFSAEVLESLGATAQETADILEDVRRRDAERMRLEITGGMYAGRELLRGNIAKPTPFTPPKRTARPLSEETADVIETMSTEPAGS